MKNLIVGNGVIIQHGGLTYSNREIIKRAINNIERGQFSKDAYPEETATMLKVLHKEIPAIAEGDYDDMAVLKGERGNLDRVKCIYGRNTKIYDVGFEDYFLIFELVCRKNKITNPDKSNTREMLKRMFLDSIYNKGRINEVYKNFSPKFQEYLLSFDNIFTTNYDQNIELVTNTEIHYLHGQFNKLHFVYDRNSLKNKLPNSDKFFVEPTKGYEHVFSTALTSDSGESKSYSRKQVDLTNSGLEKFANGFREGKVEMSVLNEWTLSENKIIRDLGEAIKLKLDNPEAKMEEQYAYGVFERMEGEIEILGLSPLNDNHIFEEINNSGCEVNYYFYSDGECDRIGEKYPNYKLSSTKEFWQKCSVYNNAGC